MIAITIEGTTEPLITTGRARRCPLCGSEFTMGSLHGATEIDLSNVYDLDDNALDYFGDLACSECLTAAANGQLETRMKGYAEFLRNTAQILETLAQRDIEVDFDQAEIQYTGTVVGGPLFGRSA